MKTVIRLNCSIPDYCVQHDETKNAFPFQLLQAIYARKPSDKELIFKAAHFCRLSVIQQSSHAALTFPAPNSIRPLQFFLGSQQIDFGFTRLLAACLHRRNQQTESTHQSWEKNLIQTKQILPVSLSTTETGNVSERK